MRRASVVALALVVVVGVAGGLRGPRGAGVSALDPGAPPDARGGSRGSFARDAEADPWLDFEGRPFARRRAAPERVLVVGGAAALALAPRLARALAPAEVPVAARPGLGVVHESVLLGRFAPILEATQVVAVDGEELAGPGVPGWTPEWTWERASIDSPLGEVAARSSGLARLLLVRPPEPVAPELIEADYARGLRSLFVLAAARGTRLSWAFAPPASAPPATRALVLETARRLALGHETIRVFATPEELLRSLER